MAFTHLHVHSHYSLLDGLPKIPQLVSHAKEQGFSSVALTDHGALYGAVEFYKEATKAGIKPIIGAELYVAQRTRFDKQPRIDSKPYHLVVVAETREGYQNLMKLISKANLEGYYYKPRVDLDLLAEHSEGLIGLSACLNGEVARSVLNNSEEAAAEVVKKYQAAFKSTPEKPTFFLEVQHNPSLPEQAQLNTALKHLSQETGAPLVATADSHYLNPDDAEAQDILLCIQMKKELADTDRMSMSSEDYSLLSEEKMREIFVDMPEAVDNAGIIAERCNVELPLGEIHMPHYEIPEGETHDSQLRKMCLEGVARKYTGTEYEKEAYERIDYELDVIKKTGYASYFLIVQDFVNWAKNNGIVVGPGRGSAAGSLVAYVTNITNIDPLKYDLLFERFLNPERTSMPDIDIDIADTRRDDVIRYVEEKYGKDHVAQIITFGTMAAKAAVRDVGRVLGLSYGYCDSISKMIPMFTDLKTAIEEVPELKNMYQSDPDATRLLDSALKLEGVVRHTSVHACGVVITEKAMDVYTPMQYASGEESITTQYESHSVEALGLLKMDFLGLKNLTIIEEAINIIEATTGEKIDIDALPLDNKKAYQLLKQGKTTGIFQLESNGMKRYLKQLKPTEFEDIIAMVALYRPGPMERIPDYISGKHGKREVTYLHPKLQPILEKTYGILVYQEQVMSLVRDMAGFTAGEGYLMIKAVAKKIKELLDEQKNMFITGCVNNGVSNSVAQKIWEFIEPFARYGFNKSHSTGYALIAYQTAYLKANYPAQFMASLLTSDQNDSDRVSIEVQEARELGLEVLPPDINESQLNFGVVKESLDTENPRIRFGLAAIKNVGNTIVEVIIAEREANGPFADIEDLLNRIHHKDLNKKSLESLIKSGAMDQLGDASTLLHNLDILLQYHKNKQAELASGQTTLFANADIAPKLHLEPGPELNRLERLQWEKELMGLFVSEHPMEALQEHLPKNFVTLQEGLQGKAKEMITWVGLIGDVRQIITRKGDPMQFIRCEDATTETEVIVFPSAMENMKTFIQPGMLAIFTGQLSKRGGESKLIVETIDEFDYHFVKVDISSSADQDVLLAIKDILSRHIGDLPVYVEIKGRLIKAESKTSESALPELQELLGATAVDLV